MSYIKLEVRSGGIYFKQEKKWEKIQFGNQFLYPPKTNDNNDEVTLISHPEDVRQKVLPLIRKSSIKGLFSYLMGETKKVREIESSSESLIEKLNLTLDRIVESLAYKKTSEPHITVFFERRDAHTRNIISPPSISLQNYSIEQAESTVGILEKPLKNIMETTSISLVDIHSFFKQSLIDPKSSDYKKGVEYILNLLEKHYENSRNEEANKTKDLIEKWKKILRENELNKKKYDDLNLDKIQVPEYNKLKEDFIDKLKKNERFKKLNQEEDLIKKLNEIINIKEKNKNFFEQLSPSIEKILKNYLQKKFENTRVTNGLITALKKIINEKPISSKVIKLIKEMYRLVDTDHVFAGEIQGLKKFQFSIFTNLSQTKSWIDPKYYPIVRGKPSYIACVNFDAYLSDSSFVENDNSDIFSWDEIVNKLKAGPNIARWGEGGIVFIDYLGLDEMGCPYNEKDRMFIEMSSLRKAGLKIKKYNWEAEEEEVSKIKKKKDVK